MNANTVEFSLLSSFEELQKNLSWYNFMKKEIEKVCSPVIESIQQSFVPFYNEHLVNPAIPDFLQEREFMPFSNEHLVSPPVIESMQQSFVPFYNEHLVNPAIPDFLQDQQLVPFPDEYLVNSPVAEVTKHIQNIVAPMLSLTERYPWILQDASAFSDETIDFLNTKILFPSIESDPKVNPLKRYEEKIKSLDTKSLDKPLNKENLCQMVSEMEQVSVIVPRKIHQPIKEIISRCGSYLLQHPEIKEFLEVSGVFLGIVISIMQIISSHPTETRYNINYNPKTIINIDSDDLEKIVAISDRVIKDQSEILSQFIESLNSNNE